MALITQSPTVGVHASTPCEARQWLRHPRKTSHMCMPTALSAMQSGEATANVVRYGIIIIATRPRSVRHSAASSSRTSIAAQGCALGSAWSHEVRPNGQILASAKTRTGPINQPHAVAPLHVTHPRIGASDHTLHPSGKWGQAFRLESASIIWGKKIL